MATKRGRPATPGKTLYLRLPLDLHSRIASASQADQRTMSDWLRVQIVGLLERKDSNHAGGDTEER